MAAVDDIRVQLSFRDHPKRIKLRKRAGSQAVEALIDLWIWAARNRPDGWLTDMDADDLAIAACWTGDAHALIGALRDTGWLDFHVDGSMSLHDWEHAQGWVIGAPDRTEKARHAAHIKYGVRKSKACGVCYPHARRMPPALLDSNLSTAPSPNPSPIPKPSPIQPAPPTSMPPAQRSASKGDKPATPSTLFLVWWDFWKGHAAHADGSGPGTRGRAWDRWRKMDLDNAEQRDVWRASRSYLDRQHRTGDKTQHGSTWLNDDWRGWLEFEAPSDAPRPVKLGDKLSPSDLVRQMQAMSEADDGQAASSGSDGEIADALPVSEA